MAASRLPRSFILTVAAVGVAARLAFALAYWVNQPLNRDEVEYLSLARSLAAGKGYTFDEHVATGSVQPFGRAPGYPFFLTVIGAGARYVEVVPATVKIAQAIVGGIGIILIGVAAFRLGGRRAAMAASLMAALHPPLVWISGYVYSEALFWPMGLGLALLISSMLERPRRALFAASLFAGAFAGAAILVRAATVPFAPIAAGWLAWKRQPVAIVGFLLGLAVVIGPWTVRNYKFYGHFVLVATDGGVTFWTGNNPQATGEGDMAANPHLKVANQALRERHPALTEEQMEPVYYREALAWIREHPLDWFGLVARKVFYLVVPIGPSYRVHSARYYGATVASLAVLIPLAIYGGWRYGRRLAVLPGMWLLAAAAVATCLVFFPQERFRIPVLDPALILLASGAFAGIDSLKTTQAAGRRAA